MRDDNGSLAFNVQSWTRDLLTVGPTDERLSYLINNISEVVFLKDAEGVYTYMNAAGLTWLGSDLTSLAKTRPTVFDVFAPDVARKIDAIDRRILSTGEAMYDFEERLTTKDGQVRWYSGTRVPIRDEDGKIVGLAGISRDITDTKRQETLRRSHAALLEMIVHGQPLPVILEAVINTVEGLLENVSGSILLLDEKEGRLWHGAAPSLPDSYTSLIDGISIGPNVGSCGTAAWRREAVYVSDTFQDPLWGNFVEIVMRHNLRSCWSTPIMGNNDVLLGTFALYSGTVRMPSSLEREIIDMATNIAGIAIDRRRAEERVHFMAHHDPLTGLSNRNLFWTQFRRAIHEAKREERLVAISYIDLNHFKQINDLHGHAVGDEVLRCLAERIMSSIRASDIAVRLGGDEFAIIFSNPRHDALGIMRRLETIMERASEPMMLENGSISITCSSGTAFYPNDGDTPEALLAKADAAMYEAKKKSRDISGVSEQYWGSGI